ncbi:MAG: methionyl-tRNA formyltransferase [Verrucomicrobiota bacterium]
MSSGKPTRIVFMASDIIAIPALEWCYDHNSIALVGVFTQPDRRAGRGKKLLPNPIKTWAQEHGLEVRDPAKLATEDADWLRGQEVDISLVMAYGQFLKTNMLEAPRIDTLNLHGSILPAYRGACPVEASILNGDSETGVSLMKLVKKMDAGPVYAVKTLPIGNRINAVELREQIGGICPELLESALPGIISGRLQAQEQDPAQVSYVRRLFKSDALIDFQQDAASIECRSRAFYPWPGTACEHGGEVLKVAGLRVEAQSENVAPAGTLVAAGNEIGIACGKGVIVPEKWQRPGGKMLDAKDFFRGYPLSIGTVLNASSSPPVITETPFEYA